MRFPPLSVIEGWPRPNYDDPPTRGPAVLVTELTTLSLALISLFLRLWVRVRQLHKAWWDDWVMVLAGVCCTGTTIDVILATQFFGWDRHIWDVPYWMMVEGRKISLAGQVLFVLASGLGKLSILISYLRIAQPGTHFLRLTWCVIAFNSASMTIFLILIWVQCSPPSSYWNLNRTQHDCISEVPGIMSQAIVTVLADFVVYVLPMPTLSRLSLPRRERVALMALFSLGAVVVVAGCMRAYWVHRVEVDTYDVTWEGYNLWIWAAVEANLGVICGCAPIIRSLFSNGGARYLRTQANKDSLYSGRTIDNGGSGADGRRKRGPGTTVRGSANSDMVVGKPYFEMVRLEAGTPQKTNPEAKGGRAGSMTPIYEAQHNNSQESLNLPRQVFESQGARAKGPQLEWQRGSWLEVSEHETTGSESPHVERHPDGWPLSPHGINQGGYWRL